MLRLILAFCSFFAFASAVEELHFVEGSQARFTLEQRLDHDDWYPLHSGWHSKITAVMDMKLISANEVEVTVSDVRFDLESVRPKPHGISRGVHYAPNSPSDSPAHCDFTRAVDHLLTTPLHFTFEADGTVKETTGQLEQLSGTLHHHFDADDLELLAISKLHYEFLLRKIFKLKEPSAKDGKKKRIQNKVSENRFKGATKDKIIEKVEKTLSHKGWKGSHKEEGWWNRTNALLQERTIAVENKLHKKGSKVSYVLKEHWKSE